jgi:hypothetical protein
MPTTRLNLLLPLNSNNHEQATRSAYHDLRNFSYDDQGNLTSRPGHRLWKDLGTNAAVYGYWWQNANRLAVVSNRMLYIIDQYGAVTTVPTSLASNRPCYFTDDGDRLFFAANGPIQQYSLGDAAAVTLTDPLAPTTTTTPIIHDGYLLANNPDVGAQIVGVGEYNVSLLPQPYEWRSDTFFSAETIADRVVALITLWRQVVVFGEQTIEFWVNDGATPFSRSGNVITNQGVPSASAIAVAVDTVYCLTHRRQILRLQDAQMEDITAGIAAELKGLSRVDDVEASYVYAGPDHYVVFNFPSDRVSFVYDIERQAWAKWGSWDRDNALWRASIAARYTQAIKWNKWFGFTRDGRILEIDASVATDVDEPIRHILRTGFVSAESVERKFPVRMVLNIRRGIGTYDEANPLNTNFAPVAVLRWRDDDRMAWIERELDLGKPGEYFQKIALYRPGAYFQRQFELEYMDRPTLTLRDFFEETEMAAV